MKIVTNDEAMKIKDFSNACVKIPLTNNNEVKFPMEILYYKEKGFSKFLLDYDFNYLKPFEKTIIKIREPLYNLVRNHNIEIYVGGFPKCVFEKGILEPSIKWKYEDKIIFYETKIKDGEKYIKPHTCEMCIQYDNCKGLREEIYDLKGKIEPLLFNNKKSEVFELDMPKLLDKELLAIGNIILKNYKADKTYGNKKIYFAKNILNSSNKINEIAYYINNNKSNFKSTYDLIFELFKSPDIEIIKKDLDISPQISIKFWKDGEDIHKSIYFNIMKHEEEDILKLSKTFGFQIENITKLEGIKLIFESGMLTLCEVVHKYEVIKNEQVKINFKEFDLDKKKTLLKFLNSMTKPIKEVSIADKYFSNKIIGKRFDAHILDNTIKINSLGVLFNKSLGIIDNCIPYSLSFEISNDKTEIIKIYFTFKDELEVEEDNLEPGQ